jgi:hypothetical protein
MIKFSLNKNIIYAFLAIALISSVVAFDPLTNAFGLTGSIMNDNTNSTGYSTYSGRPIHAENITSTSVLVGQKIDTIVVELKRTGSPTGLVNVGVFNKDLSVKQLFGSIDASTISASYTKYPFQLTGTQNYLIQSGDRIGIKFTGGDGTTSWISIMTDKNNGFDGTNSYRTYYTTTTSKWVNFTAEDLTMTLLLHAPSTVPGAPTGLTPTAGNAQVSLSWTAPSSNGGSPITGYNIYRGTASGVEAFVVSVGPSITTYNNIGLTNGQQYYYTVSAANSAGNSTTSNEANATPVAFSVSASPPTGTYNSAQIVTLIASKPATIYYTTDGSPPTISSTNHGPSPITGIPISSNSTLKFFAKDSIGNISPISNSTYTIIPPTKPTLPHYDGTKAVVSIDFEHGFSNQVGAINANMSNMPGSIAVIAQRVNHTGYMTKQQLLDLQSKGFEIVGHSETHLQITQDTPTSSICYETVQSKIDLWKMGFKIYGMIPPFLYVTTQNFPLIVPNYNYTVLLQNSPPQVGYNITFNTPQSVNASKHDLGIYDIPTWGVGAGDAIQNYTTATKLIDYAVAHKLWVDIHFHGIDYANGTWDTTPELFTKIMTYVKQQNDSGNLLVLTHAQALNLIGTDTTPIIQPGSACYGIVNFPPPPPTVVMSDTKIKTKDFGLSLYSGRPLQTEFVKSNSTLVGKVINSITVTLKRTGSPTGTVYLGVFNQDKTIKKLIGKLDASTIKPAYSSYNATLGAEDPQYTIQSGDYIGAMYTGGDSTNQLAIMTDQSGTFDGGGSYLSYWTPSKWSYYYNQDLNMLLSLIQ